MALRTSSRLLVCNQCLRQVPRQVPQTAAAVSPLINAVRFRSFATSKPTAQSSATLQKLAHEAPVQQDTADAMGKGTFPKTSSKSVAYWLLGSAASVFGIVVFGGLTRLTESG